MGKAILTPAYAGMMKERGSTVREIARRTGHPQVLVRAYLKEWGKATDADRQIARSGTRI